MDFSKFFQSQNKTDDMPQAIQSLTTGFAATSTRPGMKAFFGTTPKKEETDLDYLHKIPLAKRMSMLVDTGIYQASFRELFEKEIQHVKQAKLEKVKKENPDLVGQIGLKNIQFEEGVTDQIREHVAEMFLKAIFEKEEIKRASLHLLDPEENFTKADHDVLKICIYAWKHNLEFLAEQFGVKTGAFQSMIARGSIDLADMIGNALKNDPRTILCYGVECCRGIKGFDRGITAMAGDKWVARWLNPKMVKVLSQAKELKPLEGTKIKEATPEDIQRTRRYQSGFKTALLYYSFKSPTKAQSVFSLILPYLEKMDLVMQEQMWCVLFQKYRVDLDILSDVVSHMSSFLDGCSSDKSKRMMYSVFIKTLPSSLRGNVLGALKPKTLKRYWQAFRGTHPMVSFAPIKTEKSDSHIAWELFYRGDMTQEQLIDLLKKADLKQQKEFVFIDKKQMDPSIFSEMCSRFASSPFHFWKWIKSYQTVPDFNGSLAKIYLTLPSNIRENCKYVRAMNNHFDLVRECALNGDTGALSALKKILDKDAFWESLTQEAEGRISGIRSLCQQGKRGLLKLMADWPVEKQQALFMTTNAKGRTLWDDCTGNLVRLVAQDVFKQVCPKKEEVSVPVEPQKSVVPVEPVKPKEEKKEIQRQIIRIPVFESHMAKIANNSKLVQEVEETITALSKMSKAEISAELREGWKHHGGMDKNPCAVKDIRGKNYRLGYLLQGDIDRGTGQIAFLFFLTHAQYNIFLNKQADQAVKTAKAIMAVQKPNPNTFGPKGPSDGNDGR